MDGKGLNTTLYLARHGETVDNANHIMQGQTQGKLNENGVCQARQLAESLTDIYFDAIIASDLYRSVETARIIADYRHMDVALTPLLRERDWGSFTGRYIPSLKDEIWPNNIESLNTLLERAAKFIDYIRENYAGKTVLAIGHGIINKAIQAVYYGKPMNQVLKMTNCEVRVLQL